MKIVPNAASFGRDFYKLWAGQTISQFGSMLGALSFLAILQLDATPVQVGTLETLRSLPVLLLGLFAGVWVDRLRRRPLLIWADIGRAILLAVVAVAALVGLLRMAHLYIAAFLIGSLGVIFDIAYRSYLPTLVTQPHLVQANGRLSATESVAEIGAPGLGGLLVQLLGAPLTIVVDAGSFLLSALFLSRIEAQEEKDAVPVEKATDSQQTIWRDIQAGLRFLSHHPVLRPLVIAASVRNFFGGFFASLYFLYVLTVVELSPVTAGILVGAGGVGALVGALTIGWMQTRIGMGKALSFSLIFSGMLALLTPLASGSATTVFLMLLMAQLSGDFFGSIFFILETSVRQSAAPHELLGRINASFESVSHGVGMMGIMVGGVMGQWFGMRAALIVASIGIVASGIILFASPVRQLSTIPEAPENA